DRGRGEREPAAGPGGDRAGAGQAAAAGDALGRAEVRRRPGGPDGRPAEGVNLDSPRAVVFQEPPPAPPGARVAGRLTQRLECHPHTVEVTGSNPVAPTLPKHIRFPPGGPECG